MSSTPMLACLRVHFILQVSSILRAEPNSRACGSVKKDFSFLRITAYSLTTECCVSHTHANIHPNQLRHIFYPFAQVPPVRRGAEIKRNHKMSRHSDSKEWPQLASGTCSTRRMGMCKDMYHSSVYLRSLFVQSTQPSNPLPACHFSHLLLHREPIFLCFFTTPSSSFASKPHCIHIVLTSSHPLGVIPKPL